MPWKAIPFDNQEIRDKLDAIFEVEGIPTLILMDEEGVYNMEGRGDVTSNPNGFPWKN